MYHTTSVKLPEDASDAIWVSTKGAWRKQSLLSSPTGGIAAEFCDLVLHFEGIQLVAENYTHHIRDVLINKTIKVGRIAGSP